MIREERFSNSIESEISPWLLAGPAHVHRRYPLGYALINLPTRSTVHMKGIVMCTIEWAAAIEMLADCSQALVTCVA